ncbi:hypothetical protein TNCV_4001621 [Trichonephila clavipes]|uniref:Uncharacterized protein n=1 Tax=Trichonephila clavipes TaxID=2585209 RepID=A0A8X6RP39_TRICX|nr:hypothetical protein TNCV_4001621 [Trichonephila clavipes]
MLASGTKSGLRDIESIPNKWYCNQKDRPKAATEQWCMLHCNLALRTRRHRWTTAYQLSRDLATASEKRTSRQTIYRRLAETDLYA